MEIIVAFDELTGPQLSRRHGEVILHEPGGFRPAWQGGLGSAEEKFRREFDIAATLRSHGTTLYLNKQLESSVVQESFPLRTP
jgi:hypothetical protein